MYIKGHDHVIIVLESGITLDDSEQPHNDRQRNEIQEFLYCRYVFAIELC